MKKGFSLIELMIVIAILAILAGMITGNFINSLKKGRDTERKGDLHQIQSALEFYYHDYQAYPTPDSAHGLPFGSALEKGTTTYMKKLPQDPASEYSYYYHSDADGSFYALYSIIENNQDAGDRVSQNGYENTDCSEDGTNTLCKYGVASPNITLAPTAIP